MSIDGTRQVETEQEREAAVGRDDPGGQLRMTPESTPHSIDSKSCIQALSALVQRLQRKVIVSARAKTRIV